jgi:hypothetical protein
MRTGDMVDELGIYMSDCCDAERIFDEGDKFLRCPDCLGLCDWEFQAEITTITDPDGENGVAA